MTGSFGRWILAAAWAAFLFFMSSRPTLPVDLELGLDKVAHFGAYLVLGFLVARAIRGSALRLGLAVGLGWIYGVVDELHQSTVPGRYADLYDWIADAAGTLAGVLLFVLLERLRSPSRELAPEAVTDSPS